MVLVRDGSGIPAIIRGYSSQIHPVFMLPPVVASWFGAIIAEDVTIYLGAIHVLAVFLAVYTAHIKDGYIDYYVRGEDTHHPLTIRGCRIGLAGASIAFALCVGLLWLFVGPIAALLTIPGWVIGYLHTPYLDMNPIGATVGYPAGIALAIIGGFYVQTGFISLAVIGYALVFLLILIGVKIIDDETDVLFDQSIEKHTVAVVLGPKRGRRLAFCFLSIGLITVLWLTVDGYFPPSAPLAAVVFATIAIFALPAPPALATKLLVRGGYVFFAVLIIAVWYQPLTAIELPDITVFGQYTYLLTEIFFGSIAIGLLYHSKSLWLAIRTIIVLYPIAYLWDWYTLEVGVFAIVKRTGIDIFGIPLEEHIFILVVPAFVIGVHETLRMYDNTSAIDDDSNQNSNAM